MKLITLPMFFSCSYSVAKSSPTLCNFMDCMLACQALLSSIISWSLIKFMSIELIMLSRHLIPCCHVLEGGLIVTTHVLCIIPWNSTTDARKYYYIIILHHGLPYFPFNREQGFSEQPKGNSKMVAPWFYHVQNLYQTDLLTQKNYH